MKSRRLGLIAGLVALGAFAIGGPQAAATDPPHPTTCWGVDKTASVGGTQVDSLTLNLGESATIAYTVTVTQHDCLPGEEAINSVGVLDSYLGIGTPPGTLAIHLDHPQTFTYSRTVTAETCGNFDVTNTVRVREGIELARDTVTIHVTVVCGVCHETVNPAGNPAVGDNGFPNDPFGGDAVPGGKSTSPGTRGNGPINSDGFYLVGGLLYSDTTPIPFSAAPGGNGVAWPTNTTIKYTEWGNPKIKITSQIGGPKSVIQFHVQAPGDLFVNAPKGAAGAVFCGVPPPPF
jgi:hypothetical protein